MLPSGSVLCYTLTVSETYTHVDGGNDVITVVMNGTSTWQQCSRRPIQWRYPDLDQVPVGGRVERLQSSKLPISAGRASEGQVPGLFRPVF